ncbi:hypothetical protein GCM10023085_44860 [Actinomadura viridis]
MSDERLMSKPGLLLAAIYLVAGFVFMVVLSEVARRVGAPAGAAIGGAVLAAAAGARAAVLRSRTSR